MEIKHGDRKDNQDKSGSPLFASNSGGSSDRRFGGALSGVLRSTTVNFNTKP